MQATGPDLSTIAPKLGGTSYTDPGFTTTAVITSPISANVETDCFPADPNPAWSTTTIVPNDTDPPVITINTPADGGQYPLGVNVAANYTCDDGTFGSGVATCDGDVANGSPIDTSALGPHSFTVNASDNNGNNAIPVTHNYTVVPAGNDHTPPTATITTPANGVIYTQGAVVNADYACADNESGLASCDGTVANGAAIDTSSAGAHTFTVTATDNEGNPYTVVSAYSVQPAATQQDWTTGDVTDRMPVGCDTLFGAFHESIPTSSNTAPTSAAAGGQFDWNMAIATDQIPTLNNATNLIYRWKPPTNGHFVSAAFTGPGSEVNGATIGINGDGTLELDIASVTDQSIFGFGADYFNPPPFQAVVQVDGAPGTTVQNEFDYFQITTTTVGVPTTQHCPAGDPGYNGRVNVPLTTTNVVDATPPTISVTSPTNGATYAPGATVPFTYSCADDQGTPTCDGDVPSGDNLDTSTSGVFQVHVTSVDGAGNTAQQWVTYTVGDPEVSVSDATVTEGPGATLDFTVSLSNPSQNDVVVDYTTADGSAVAPGDYTAQAGVLTFSSGGPLTQTVSVPVNNDNVFTGNRDLELDLTSAVHATIADGSGTGTIIEDDQPPVTVDDAAVTEGPGAMLDFAVSLAADPNTPVTVDYATADGTAVAPTRYADTSGTLTFNPGDPLVQHVLVPVVDDNIYNENASSNGTQTMTLTATESGGQSDVGTGTITDDETKPPVLNIGSTSLFEGDSGKRSAKLTVTLTRPATSQVTVHYSTHAGTATTADFKAKNGNLTFKAGVISKTISIVVQSDTLAEGDENFTVVLSSPTNALIGADTGTVTILDDDSPTSASTVAQVGSTSVYEGGGSTKKVPLVFNVTLNQPPGAAVTLKYHTVTGSANATDYKPKSGTLKFKATQVSKTVSIGVIPDTTVEANESFTLVIDTPTGPISIGNDTGTGMIFNDD